MPKKSKGRGRGRGRGNPHHEKQQTLVGQQATSRNNEHKQLPKPTQTQQETSLSQQPYTCSSAAEAQGPLTPPNNTQGGSLTNAEPAQADTLGQKFETQLNLSPQSGKEQGAIPKTGARLKGNSLAPGSQGNGQFSSKNLLAQMQRTPRSASESQNEASSKSQQAHNNQSQAAAHQQTQAGPQQTPARSQQTPAGPQQTQAGPQQTPAGPQQTQAGPQQTQEGPQQTPARSQQTPAIIGSTTTADEHLARHRQENMELPKRPGYGREGRKIKLRANFFQVTLPNVDFLYHYDLEISPEKAPVSVCRDVVDAAIKHGEFKGVFNGCKPAFDGRRNLYCREPLPLKSEEASLKVTLPGTDGGKERKFTLKIKEAGLVSIKELDQFLNGEFRGKVPQDAIQGMDIVLRQMPSMKFTAVGRCFFPPPNGHCHDLGGGCELWTGFYQSVRPSQWKTMLLNIDVSSKGFQKSMPVIDFMLEILRQDRNRVLDTRWVMDERDKKKLTTEIKGLRVETTHIKRKFTVMGLSHPAFNNRFRLEDNTETTVEAYFRNKYNISLRYPHLPCLLVGQKKNSVPMEVCNMIPTQRKRLTDEQTAAMIRKTAKPANERQRDINQWVDELATASDQYLKNEYGMRINKQMVAIEGRVLPAPELTLGGNPQGSALTPSDGAWDMRGKSFFEARTVEVWALVCFSHPKWCPKEKLEGFARQMGNVCRSEGMRMNPVPCRAEYASRVQEVEGIFGKLLHDFNSLQLIVVALPDRGNKDVYNEVKRVGDTVLGIPTQCVQMKQFTMAKPQVCSNIAMKINGKLGGTNHVIADSLKATITDDKGNGIFNSPVIIFGADVTHPAPGDNGIPSIAAVVASLNRNASRYCARVRPQTHMKCKQAQEIIVDLADMVKELMIEFYKENKRKPVRIIFYRDGVSEGQFQQVLLEEVRAVQQACAMLEKDYQPLITFVVVQKRHHARLFAEEGRDARGKSRNVPAGTTVDTVICHPFEFDFYLCSHAGIQGTSRPTHYHVLYDDNGFSADKLQALTYQLCHTFARCTRSVSMPAPAYYAHLAAFRARGLVNAGRGAANGSEESQMKTYYETIKVCKRMEASMYFT